MRKKKYLILGAGPAGLTVANCLKQKGENSFLVLEKEDEAGGLCRSMEVDGSPLDIGGGHILDVRRPKVTEFLFRFMPEEEWDSYGRISRIQMGDVVIDYPFEANIWELPVEEQVRHLVAISKAGCNNGVEKPEKFSQWIPWKLGEKIAHDYMIPYNSKIWSMDLDRLGTYWLDKLPNVSFEETLLSCLTHKPYGTLPGHARFYYPKKYGYGELWLRMAEAIEGHIEYGVDVREIDFDTRAVNGEYQADVIINTIPWTCFSAIQGADQSFFDNLGKLVHTSVVVKYFEETLNTDAHWAYFPDQDLEYHRIMYRHTFCPGARGYWTETNLVRSDLKDGHWHYINDYAYPVSTVDKPQAIQEILSYARKRNVLGLGRWGEWQHYNSDRTVELAMQLADELV